MFKHPGAALRGAQTEDPFARILRYLSGHDRTAIMIVSIVSNTVDTIGVNPQSVDTGFGLRLSFCLGLALGTGTQVERGRETEEQEAGS